MKERAPEKAKQANNPWWKQVVNSLLIRDVQEIVERENEAAPKRYLYVCRQFLSAPNVLDKNFQDCIFDLFHVREESEKKYMSYAFARKLKIFIAYPPGLLDNEIVNVHPGLNHVLNFHESALPLDPENLPDSAAKAFLDSAACNVAGCVIKNQKVTIEIGNLVKLDPWDREGEVKFHESLKLKHVNAVREYAAWIKR